MTHLNRWFCYALNSNKNDTVMTLKLLYLIYIKNLISAIKNGVHTKEIIISTNPLYLFIACNFAKTFAEIVWEHTFIDNIEKISPCTSTKQVESFKIMLKNKASKAEQLSSSSSLECRVDCNIAKKKYGYISQVYAKSVVFHQVK